MKAQTIVVLYYSTLFCTFIEEHSPFRVQINLNHSYIKEGYTIYTEAFSNPLEPPTELGEDDQCTRNPES